MPKKTKAVKISDSNKAWNKKNASSYKIKSIPVNKTILIICEGQTEKLYFESFPVLGAKVKIIDSYGQSKLKLVQYTKDFLADCDEKYDEIWCVFDMDFHKGETEFQDFDNAISKAFNLGYQVAYSNDSFELWFYLHYKTIDSQQLRTFYYEELSKFFGLNYEKEGKKYKFCMGLYNLLNEDSNSSQSDAIKRAKILYENCQTLPFHEQNPVTKVYELVTLLNENLKR